jgi:hypothetical protein
MSLLGKPNPEADANRRCAEDAEAMFVGGMREMAVAVRDLRDELNEVKDDRLEIIGKSIDRLARGEAYKRLSEEIIKELQDTTKPRRFSDPNNGAERRRLLELAHQRELSIIKKRNLDAKNKAIDHPLLVGAQERSHEKTLEEYAAFGPPTRTSAQEAEMEKQKPAIDLRETRVIPDVKDILSGRIKIK